MIHELKILPEWFEDVTQQKKTFEIRKNDRNYSVGDTLVLREWYKGKYTGLVNSRINELATTDAIPIPEGVTNGDMIQNMFPNLRVEDNGGPIYLHYPDGGWIVFDRDWWNAQYKFEGESE